MAILPLAGWAAVPTVETAPVAKTGLVYSGSAQGLIAASPAPEASAGNIYYLVSDATSVTFDASTWSTTVPQGTNAGTYKVWYCAYLAGEGNGNSVPEFINVTIAKQEIKIDAKDPTPVTYGQDYTAAGLIADSWKYNGDNHGSTVTTLLQVTPTFKTWPTTKPVKWTTGASPVVTTYDFEISAVTTDDNYTVTVVTADAKIKILQKDLEISTVLNDGQPATIAYGDNLPTWHLVYDGLIAADNTETDPLKPQVPASGVFPQTLDYTVKTPGNVNYYEGTGTFNSHSGVVGNVSVYNVNWINLDNKNYNITNTPATFTINPKSLTVAMIQQVSATAKVYNKTDQKAVNNTDVTDVIVKDGTKTLVSGTDYSFVTKQGNGSPLVESKAIAAGTYKVEITGLANYTATVSKDFAIAKKPLGVRTKSKTVEYNTADQKTTITGAAITTTVDFDGFVTGVSGVSDDTYDNSVITGHGLSLKLQQNLSDVTEAKNAGAYNIVFVNEDADAFTNYAPVYVNDGVFTISPKEITVTPVNKEKKYGVSDNYVAGVEAQAADLTFAPTLTSLGLTATQYPTLKREAGESKGDKRLYWEGAIKVKNGDNVNVTDNYTFTPVDGKFTIKGGTITVYADSKEITYGDTPATLTASIFGMTQNEIQQVQSVVNGTVDFDINPLTEDPTQAGVYKLKIGDVAAALTESFPEIMANYDETVNKFYASATYTVKKAALKIEALTQSLTTGATVLPASESTVKIITTGMTDDDIADLFDATNGIKLAFSGAAPAVPNTLGVLDAAAATTGWNGSTATADGVWVNGIVINAATYNALTTVNYTLDDGFAEGAEAKAGKLIVTAAGSILYMDANATDDAVVAALNDKDGKKMNVTIKNRPIDANMWTVMVLPFTTTAREISEALGYAVVDVLNKDKGNGNEIYFKLTMGEIPANTPFIVKTDVKHTGDIAFTSHLIEKCGQLTSADNKDQGGSIYYGVYQNYTINGDKQLFLSTKVDGKWGYQNKDNTIVPTKAFIQLPDGSTDARVFIEEPDGSTTAITIVNSDAENANAEGWYNINGIRMQSVPTVKGLYIHNGKKVVVK